MKHKPTDPRFKGATPEKLAKALRLPQKPKPARRKPRFVKD